VGGSGNAIILQSNIKHPPQNRLYPKGPLKRPKVTAVGIKTAKKNIKIYDAQTVIA
jgi:hypothetical protein